MNYKSLVFDLEMDFSELGRFDIIICFGLLEVVRDVSHVVSCCCRMSDSILVETMVCDSENSEDVVVVDLDPTEIDCPLSGKSVRPSPFFVERLFKENGFSFVRHFTSDLNAGHHRYDWTHRNTRQAPDGMRRFWHASRAVPRESLNVHSGELINP